MASTRVLLGTEVTPKVYNLTLEPDLVNFKFDGSETIEVEVNKSVDVVVLHANDLTIDSASATDAEGKKLKAVSIEMNFKECTASIKFEGALPVGKATLSLSFRGNLNESMCGFYRSSYKTLAGETKYLATTQFEATDARRCFPCWDEPSVKAIFNITVIHSTAMMAISNMPEASIEQQPNGKTKTSFLSSPIMSTYLLAIIVGEFDYIQSTTKNGTLIRCLCTPGKSSKMSFSLDVAIKSLEFYNEYFDLPYPLPKCDMIAIPDFSAGAMENWGLVTYREIDMLVDLKNVSMSTKKRVCTVVTHELAHQWFGNLVTMAWWDGLWLNEGFACWMQTMVADHIFPEWKLWESFVACEQSNALDLDALRSSHPIQVDIARSEDVDEVFDAISYCKGACVIRLIYKMIGAENFKKGLRLYLKKHQFGNTETTDLWNAFQEASGMPIEETMSSWTSKMGFPLLTVGDWKAADGKSTVTVSQNWFVADGSELESDKDKVWVVPMLFGSDKGESAVEILKEKKGTFTVNGEGWLKANFGQHIPLRVKYESNMLVNLTKSIKDLSAEDRIGLLSDYTALLRCGKVTQKDFMQVLNSYGGEENDKVWTRLATSWSIIMTNLKYTKLENKEELLKVVAKKAEEQAKPLFKNLGWDNKETDDDNTKQLRSSAISLLLSVTEDPEIIKEAEERFNEFVINKETPRLTADIQGAVFSLLVKVKGAEIVEKLREIHNGTDESRLRILACSAVAKSKDMNILKEWLYWGLNSGKVRNQDFIYVLRSMCVASIGANIVGGELMKDFAHNHYEEVYALVGSSKMMFASVVKCLFAGLVTREEGEELKKYLEGKKLTGMELSMKQGIEALDVRLQFAERTEVEGITAATYGA
eukprot:TRINITY_DN3254_c0_g1_i1.p1 TRINITY_DN3254_c0_g1~~TRINITY_DN3254_c0_g1_i1.p1  ORF type:complete len:889 (+),score=233.93 TRINITY_DN3254_c0_g1_i1:43-2667(+)